MMWLILLFCSLAEAKSDASRHQLTFGDKLGMASSISTSAADKTAFGIDDFTVETQNIAVTYAYRFADRWQAGFAAGTISDEQEIKFRTGEIETEVRQTHVFIFFTYNFHDQLQKAYYLTAIAGRQHFEHASNDKRIGTEIDVEYDLTTYGLSFGKRWIIKEWDESSITYSPNISYYISEGGGDLANDGVDNLRSVRADIVRFDFLF